MNHSLSDYEKTLTTAHIDIFGFRMAQAFMQWRNDPDFTCKNFTAICTRQLGLPKNSNLIKAAEMAFGLADEKNDNGYHNHHHNREVIASQTELTRETLSRTLHKFEEDGLIELAPQHITILNRSALYKLFSNED